MAARRAHRMVCSCLRISPKSLPTRREMLQLETDQSREAWAGGASSPGHRGYGGTLGRRRRGPTKDRLTDDELRRDLHQHSTGGRGLLGTTDQRLRDDDSTERAERLATPALGSSSERLAPHRSRPRRQIWRCAAGSGAPWPWVDVAMTTARMMLSVGRSSLR